ncbi:cysteine desulfurase family protein [Paenibacillus sp. CAU 1782]
MKETLYMDYSASAPLLSEVADTLLEVTRQIYSNPSSLHEGGIQAAKLIQRSRTLVGEKLGTSSGNWLFTSGGTESNNLAIKGAARQYRSRGNHIITTAIEHASVHESMLQLQEEGFHVTFLPVGPEGHVSVTDVEAALTKDTILVSIMHVNNEIGTVQPIEEIGRLLSRRPKTLFHVDAVQSIGKLPLAIEKCGIHLLSASAHKLGGPRGVGLLYVRDGVTLQPLLSGGSQEFGLRPGTENVPSIVAAAKAVRLAAESAEDNSEVLKALRDKLRKFVEATPELKLNGAEPLAPHIVHFSYPGMKPEVIIHMLEQHGILASTRSACSSKDSKPSRVLLALGASSAQASGGVRISFGNGHREEHVDALIQALGSIISQLKHLERST